jgi:hypothetical protein
MPESPLRAPGAVPFSGMCAGSGGLDLALALVVAVTLLGTGAPDLTGLKLQGGEARYWSWAKLFSFGY